MLTEKEQEKLYDFFEKNAEKVKIDDEYWISDDEREYSYCHDCCQKEIEKLRKKYPEIEFEIDGGGAIAAWDSDSSIFCQKCGMLLEYYLTNFGCEQEVDHFLEHGFKKTGQNCYDMMRVIDSMGWESWDADEVNDNILNYYEKLNLFGQNILKVINGNFGDGQDTDRIKKK